MTRKVIYSNKFSINADGSEMSDVSEWTQEYIDLVMD